MPHHWLQRHGGRHATLAVGSSGSQGPGAELWRPAARLHYLRYFPAARTSLCEKVGVITMTTYSHTDQYAARALICTIP